MGLANPASCVIANGQSLSGALTLEGNGLIDIEIPSGFTGTSLTFQVSLDGTNFYEFDTSTGAAYSETVPGSLPAVVQITNPGDFVGFEAIKIRAGTVGSPSTQGAAMTLQCSIRSV